MGATRCESRHSLLVLFTDAAEPASLAALAKPLAFLGRKHLVLCVVFRDLGLEGALADAPSDVPGLYRMGAAAELAAEREQSVRRLSRAGILVLEATQGQLSTSVVNRYLEIKARRLCDGRRSGEPLAHVFVGIHTELPQPLR